MTIIDSIKSTDGLMTRNFDYAKVLDSPSFWLADEKTPLGDNKMNISTDEIKNGLKLKQSHGHICKVYPVDGANGCFNNGTNNKLPVKGGLDFSYQWKDMVSNTFLKKEAGDCDCLIVDNKWHFIEFKTEAMGNSLVADSNNMNKATAQLARSMTSFKEQLDSPMLPCICIIVKARYYPSFPSIKRNVEFKKKWGVGLIEIKTDPSKPYYLE
jgi:hypothetical protein